MAEELGPFASQRTAFSASLHAGLLRNGECGRPVSGTAALFGSGPPRSWGVLRCGPDPLPGLPPPHGAASGWLDSHSRRIHSGDAQDHGWVHRLSSAAACQSCASETACSGVQQPSRRGAGLVEGRANRFRGRLMEAPIPMAAGPAMDQIRPMGVNAGGSPVRCSQGHRALRRLRAGRDSQGPWICRELAHPQGWPDARSILRSLL